MFLPDSLAHSRAYYAETGKIDNTLVDLSKPTNLARQRSHSQVAIMQSTPVELCRQYPRTQPSPLMAALTDPAERLRCFIAQRDGRGSFKHSLKIITIDYSVLTIFGARVLNDAKFPHRQPGFIRTQERTRIGHGPKQGRPRISNGRLAAPQESTATASA